MIAKSRDKPRRILMNEALLRRLPRHHNKRKDIEEDLKRRMAGYEGEKQVDFHIVGINLQNCYVLKDLRLQADGSFFQIDCLVVNPRFLLVVEVKNMSGTLFFDANFNQLIRSINGREEGFRDPFLQARRQTDLLKKIASKFFSKEVPCEYSIIISNPSTILKTNSPGRVIYEKVMHAESLSTRIEELNTRYPTPYAGKLKVKKFLAELKRLDTPVKWSILKEHGLRETELITGVQCPSCLCFGMERVHGKWKCPRCYTFSSTAHEQAVHDFLLLINTSISNSQCRTFLQLTSSDVACRLLKKMQLNSHGKGKGKRYSQE